MRRAFFLTFLVFAVGCTQSNPPTVDTSTPDTPPPTPSVDTPKVTSSTLADAQTALRHEGLTWSVTKKPSKIAAGTILNQGPAPGTAVDVGTTVSLTVAVPLPRIPNVVGILQAKASSILKRADYQVKVSRQDTTTHRNLEVLDQDPKAGTEALAGKTVTLVVWHNICTPGYSPCLPLAYDYDCSGGSGDGPKYTGLVKVTGNDPYGLDADNDGYGCE
jgi:resuscitation-promoting factor RpfB